MILILFLILSLPLYGSELLLPSNPLYFRLRQLILSSPNSVPYSAKIEDGKPISRRKAFLIFLRLIKEGDISDMKFVQKFIGEFSDEIKGEGLTKNGILSNFSSIDSSGKIVSGKRDKVEFGVETRFRYESNSFENGRSSNGFHMRNRFNLIIHAGH
jgi:hypothetical protein